MTNFTMEVAGICIRVSTLFKHMERLCTEYLCDREPDFSVDALPEDIVFEREKSAREDILEGKPVQEYSDAYLESLALYRKIANKMVDYDTLLFHGSVIAVDGEAYLFTAKSGTGKSTHTRNWRRLFGDRAIMVNDDKPLLKITGDGVLACGTPWDGKHHLSTNVCLPLKAICILERGEKNQIREISAKEALPMVFQQTHTPKNKLRYMELIDQLAQKVAFYRLSCNMEPEAAKVSYEGMSGKKL